MAAPGSQKISYRLPSTNENAENDIVECLLCIFQDSTRIIELNELDITWRPKLGAGVFSEVYKAVWKQPNGGNTAVALKVLQLGPSRYFDVLREEIDALVKLSGKSKSHFVQLLGLTVHQGKVVLVLEFMPNGTLLEKITSPQISIDKIKRWMAKIAEAMEFLHSCVGGVHGDLHPGNILMDETDQPKVSDFSLYKRVAGNHANTSAEYIGGHPMWCDPRTPTTDLSYDVFSFGLILWALLARTTPLPLGETPSQASREYEQGFRPPIPDNAPPDLCELIQQCWAPEPRLRPTFSHIRTRLLGGHITPPLALRQDEHQGPMMELDERNTNPQIIIHNLPALPEKHVDRLELIESIRLKIATQLESHTRTTSPCVELRGPVSIGKTDVAVAYARYMLEAGACGGAWVFSMGNTAKLYQNCIALLDQLGGGLEHLITLEEMTSELVYRVNQTRMTWVLVLDDVDKADNRGAAFIRALETAKGKSRRYLVKTLTVSPTENTGGGDVDTSTTVFVGEFTLTETRCFFQLANIPGDEAQLLELARVFGYHPLALRLLAKTLEFNKPEEVLTLMATRSGTNILTPLRTMYKQLLDKLQPEQLNMLQVIAMLSPDGVETDLLCEIAVLAAPLDADETDVRAAVKEVLNQLAGYRLITPIRKAHDSSITTATAYSMVRPLRDEISATPDWLEYGSQTAFRLVQRINGGKDMPEKLSRAMQLMPHLDAILANYDGLLRTSTDPKHTHAQRFAHVHYWYGMALAWKQRDFVGALNQLNQATEILKDIAESKPEVAVVLEDMSDIMVHQGRLVDALKTLQLAETYIRTSNVETQQRGLPSVNCRLGAVLCQLSKYHEAYNHLVAALFPKRPDVDSPEETDANVWFELGCVLIEMGELQRARAILETTLQCYQRIYNTEVHSDITANLHALARLYCILGDLPRARELLMRSLSIEVKLRREQGANTPAGGGMYAYEITDVLLAQLSADQGNIEHATSLLGRPPKVVEELLQKGTTGTRTIEIAVLLRETARLMIQVDEHANAARALIIAEEALRINGEYDTMLGGEQNDRVAACYEVLGTIHGCLGNFENAKECLSIARSIKKTIFRPDEEHWSSADTLFELGHALVKSKALAYRSEAVEHLTRSMDIRRKVLGHDEHPKTMLTKKLLAQLKHDSFTRPACS